MKIWIQKLSIHDCTYLEDEDLEAINAIQEDLEILDILRQHLYVAPELVELKMTGKEYANIYKVKYHNGIPIVVDRKTFDKINKWFDESGRRK